MRAQRNDKLRALFVVLVLLLFAAFYLFQERNVAKAFGFPIDDAWIHCQFARNIVRGNGMSYNPGVPIAGSTAPLWTYVMAASYLIHPNFILTAKVISLALYALSCFLVFKVIVFVTDDVRYAFLGAMFTAMSSKLMWGALSGMEVMLSVFLTLLGIYLHLLYRKKSGPKQYAGTVVFALASLARPESMVLIFIAVLDHFLLSCVEREKRLGELVKRALFHVSLFVILLIPYFAFNFITTGDPFPSTFAAKRGGGIAVAIAQRDFGELSRTFFMYPRMYLSRIFQMASNQNLLLYWLMFIGIPKIFVDSFRRKTRNRALMIPLTFLLYPVAAGIMAPSRDTLVWAFRYMGNLLPLFVILAVVGLSATVTFLNTLVELWVGRESARKITRAGLASVVVVLLLSLSTEEYENSKFYAHGVKSINDMQVKIGCWLRNNSPPDALVAANDIGAIAFFSEREVLDLVGIVTPEILPYKKRREGVFEFISQKKPDYVVIFPKWFPQLVRREELIPLFDVTLEANAVCGEASMNVYKTVWADKKRIGATGGAADLALASGEGADGGPLLFGLARICD